MIYTEEQLQRWWDGLAEARRQEILQTMVERAPDERFCEFAQSLRRQWEVKQHLTPKQLNAVRKWCRD